MNQTSLVGRPLAALTSAMVTFAEKRGVWSGPLTSSSPELARLWGAPASSTGIGVNESSAYTYSVFWACVNDISTDIASFPLMFYKRESDGGKTLLRDHKLFQILHDAPNPEMSAFTFRGLLTSWALTSGMGYAEVVRDGMGRVSQLWPITPDRVTVRRGVVPPYPIYYEVSRQDGGVDQLSPDQIFVLPGSTVDGVNGRNIINMARESIGLGLAAERFGGTFFGNGATFGGVFEHPGRMSEPAMKNFRESVNAQHQGVDRAHKFIVVEENMKYQKLGIDPNNAQFIETRQHQIEEMCRWFRMPPHKVQHLLRTSYNSVEQLNIEYTSDTLLPNCVRWEQEISRQLIAPSERRIQFAKHTMDSKLRGDTATRYEAYAKGIQFGFLSADDVREKEDMNPLPNGQGNVYLVPQNMAPANRIDEIIDKQVAPDPKPVAPVSAPTRAEEASHMVDLIRTALGDVESRIAETTVKITMAEADALRWKDSAGAFEADLEIHRANLTAAQTEADRLKAVLLEATERADRLALEQEALRAESEATKAQLQTADQMMVDTSKALIASHARVDLIEADYQRVCQEKQDAETKLTDLTAQHAEAVTVLHAASESERAAAEQRVTDLQAQMDTATRAQEARASELAQRDADLAAAKAREATLTATVDALREEASATATRAGTYAAERDTIRSSAEDAATAHAAKLAAEQAARVELEQQLAAIEAYKQTLLAQVDTLRAEAAEATQAANAAQLAVEVATVDATGIRTAAEQIRATLTAQLATEQAERASIKAELDAMKDAESEYKRALITTHWHANMSVMASLIGTETERVRKNQGTPTKLKSWAIGYHILNEEKWIDALRPNMRNHLAFVKSTQDVDVYTRALVHPQLEAALDQLKAICDGDPDEFPVAVDKLITRWLRDRPAAIADAIQQEEIRNVGTL